MKYMKHAASVALLAVLAFALAAVAQPGIVDAQPEDPNVVFAEHINERDAQIADLETEVERLNARLDSAHVWRENVQERAVRLRGERDALAAQIDAGAATDPVALFTTGYVLGGGTNVAPFISGACGGIIGGESSYDADAVNRNSNRSIDRGPVQINSIHADTFQAVTGHAYETGAHDWVLSGVFAAFLEDRRGNLNDWVAFTDRGCGT